MKGRRFVPTVAVAGLVGLSLLSPMAMGIANAETVVNNNVFDRAGDLVALGRFVSTKVPAPAGNFVTEPAGTQIGRTDGWTVLGDNVDLNSNGYIPPPPGDTSQTQTVDLSGDGNNDSKTDGIETVLSTTAGDTYTVGFELANNPYGTPSADTMTVSATGGATTAYTGPATSSNASAAAMNWEHETYTFTATGSSTTLTFISTTTSAYGPVVTDIATGITEIEVGIPTIPAGSTGTLNLEMIGPDAGWTSDTNLADSGASSQVTFTDAGGNKQVSPTEVTGGPFPTAERTLTYQVKVPADAKPGSTITATVPSTFTDSAGDAASIHVEIMVAPVAGTPMVDPPVAGGMVGGAAVVGGLIFFVRRRRLSRAR